MDQNKTPSDPWSDDLFYRKPEAEQIHAYIKSIAGRPIQRNDKKAFTLAIEGDYGQGKTFFLKRLAQHLSENHPVAYCDAWADDFTNEPLTALAATLQNALNQFKDEQKIRSFLEKTGKVSSIIARGILRRGAAIVISDTAVEALEAINVDLDADRKGHIEDLSEGLSSDVEDGASEATTKKIMIDRIREFRDGRKAIEEVKQSLRSIIAELKGEGLEPPIVIIIDELDRCKPSYAINLLEEIKHLFDVSGVVFILGVNSAQLGFSVSGVYGDKFDGRAYLKRFIDRSYSLKEARLERLLEVLWEQSGLSAGQFRFPDIIIPQERGVEGTPADFIAELMRYYGLGARDAFEVMDILQTSAALSTNQPIIIGYFLPLVIAVIKGRDVGELSDPVQDTRWRFLTKRWADGNEGSPVTPHEYAKEFADLLKRSRQELFEIANREGATKLEIFASQAKSVGIDPPPIWSPASYAKLLRTVDRFSNPHVPSSE